MECFAVTYALHVLLMLCGEKMGKRKKRKRGAAFANHEHD
jgi:hypothetical protein